MYQPKPVPFTKDLDGISKKTMEIHHDKLYVGYVNKSNEVAEKLKAIAASETPEGNATYSELRALKNGETFANNGVYLHENYFAALGGDGALSQEGNLTQEIKKAWGSEEKFLNYFTACAMASRGWTVLAWDLHQKQLKIFNGDAHNQGGIWGALPLLALDVYEHAYFIDFGSDRKAYIQHFFKNINWAYVESLLAQYLKSNIQY